MRASHGVGCVVLLGASLCVFDAAAEPPVKGAPEPAGQASSAGGTAAREEARRLFDIGRAAAARGEWEAAYTAQRAAYANYPHAQIAGALGDAAFVLKKYPEAIEMLSQRLREPAGLSEEERKDKEKRLADAKALCGTLFIDAPDGAEVRVDGAFVGKHPLGEVLYLLPGAHTVDLVSAAGTTTQKVEVAAGQSARVEARPGTGSRAKTGATSTAPGPRVETAPGPSPAGAPPTAGPSMLPVVLLGTAAGLGAIAGGVLLGVSAAKEDEAATKLAELGQVQRPCLTAPCQEIAGLLRERDALGTAALGVWIGAGIVGGAAATVAILQRAQKPASAATWAPVVSATGAGVVVSGSF